MTSLYVIANPLATFSCDYRVHRLQSYQLHNYSTALNLHVDVLPSPRKDQSVGGGSSPPPYTGGGGGECKQRQIQQGVGRGVGTCPMFKPDMRSIGMGNSTEVPFSAPIKFRVCRYLSCRAVGERAITLAASLRAREAFNSP